jgi:hypothetical protein
MVQASKELENGGREAMEKFVAGLSPEAAKALHQYMKEHAQEMVGGSFYRPVAPLSEHKL